ncbi:MAG: TIGR02099 family protein [Nitrosomonadales bacterium]|nr:TIGR02099 family protein [Nitrosomonadales bacterium]
MLNSLPVRLLWRSLNWLTRLTLILSLALAVLLSLTIILMRYWVLPNAEQYRDRITASLANATGNPVSIGRIESDWQGVSPRLALNEVQFLDEHGVPALTLPRIGASVSWLSLLYAELRLSNLEIDRPELLIRRDAQGNNFIGGVAMSKAGGDNDLADWLLRQSRMQVRDALIVWVDEQRAAPPLVLQKVNLRVESFFSHHRFAMRALPPQELATPLDVRGDFHGDSFDDMSQWRGQLYTLLDYTDITAWRPWLNLPNEFSQGRGALRGWLGIEQGKLTEVTADMDLRDVVTKLGADVPELVLLSLRGRAGWKSDARGLEVLTKSLTMRLQNGVALQPTDFYFHTTRSDREKPVSAEMRANRLQLESLSSLAGFLPLDAGLRAQLDAYAPRGRVSNLSAQWQGALGAPDSFTIKGKFDNLALRQVGKMPGFSGLSFDVDGSADHGKLHINARQLEVDAPGVMREALSFATLTGQVGWQHRQGELLLAADNFALANNDLAGNLYGSYQTQRGTLGVLDLTANLTRGDVRSTFRYTPLVAVEMPGNDWLKSALQAGHTEDLRIRIKGNLSDFPPGGAKEVLFEIGGHARDVAIEFDKSWPRIEGLDGELLIRGNRLEVKASAATMMGARLLNCSATLPDLKSADLPLEVRGKAQAPGNILLQFVQRSPVRGYIDGFTDGMSASGNAQLELYTRIPLLSNKPVSVSGSVHVQDSDIDLGEGVPLLRKTKGVLSFTESGMQARDVTAEILGGAATINVQSAPGGAVHASVQGRNNLDVLRGSNPHPVLKYVHGGAAWNADIEVVKKKAQLRIDSTLQGISSDLPQPLNKRAGEVMPLHIEKRSIAEGQDAITVQLGKLLGARLARREENGAMVVKRGTISFGGQAKWPDGPTAPERQAGYMRGKEGVWLVGTLPMLSLQGWGGLLGADGGGQSILPVVGMDLRIAKVNGYGLNVNALNVSGGKRGDGFVAQLASSALNGEVEWQPLGDGKLSLRLQNLQWDGGGEQAAGKAPSAESTTASPDNLPAVQVAIENLQVKGRQIGRLELLGHPDGQDWRLRRLRVTNPDGTLTGDGLWHGDAANTRSSVNLLLEISDAGKILDRSGYPNTVKHGSGKFAVDVSWAGRPDEFNYATLGGTLKLDTGKGQFLKMEPGIGKLLGILSLQALPRHITLDFNDVFSEGFQFDSINGNATIKAGVIDTQDFHIDGSAAKVTMKGYADMNTETQNLRVTVLPTLGDSVSLIGAFAAGPAVGIGSLIINKILGNPLDKLVSFEYNVSGTWSDPKVVKLGQAPVQNKQLSD